MSEPKIEKLICGVCGQAMHYLYKTDKGTFALCAQRENDPVHCNESMEDKNNPKSTPIIRITIIETKLRMSK